MASYVCLNKDLHSSQLSMRILDGRLLYLSTPPEHPNSLHDPMNMTAEYCR